MALKQLDAKRLAGMVLTMVDSDKIVQFGQSDAVVFSKRLHQYYQHWAWHVTCRMQSCRLARPSASP